MSYDIAVWEGERPDSADEAVEVYADLAEQYLEEEVPPSQKITNYIEALLQRWPDNVGEEGCPWASNGAGDAGGPVVTLNIVYGRQEEVSAYAGALAKEHGLVCYDLQEDRLLP